MSPESLSVLELAATARRPKELEGAFGAIDSGLSHEQEGA
jgi:hypothetical protein